MRATKRMKASLLCAAVVMALPIVAFGQGKNPVKVGIVSSKSGVFAEQGEEIIRAIVFGIEQANAEGGIDGHKIEYQEGDDEGTPDAGRRVAEKMAREGYNLLIGAIPSSVSLTIVQNLDRWDAAYFSVASKSNKLTGDTCRPRSFITNHTDAMDIAMINQWARHLPGTTFGVMAADYVWGHDSEESFKHATEKLGKKIPIALFAPLGTKDFSPYVAQLKAANLDAIWVVETGRDAIAFVKQAAEFGLIPKTKLFGHSLIHDFTIRATDNLLEGTVSTSSYIPDIDTAGNKQFVAAWKAKFGRLPTDTEGQAYNGIQVLLAGVHLAGSVKPADIAKSLPGATIETIYGKVLMRAQDHQLLLPNFVAKAKVVDGLLRATQEERFPPSIIPAASPLCKM